MDLNRSVCEIGSSMEHESVFRALILPSMLSLNISKYFFNLYLQKWTEPGGRPCRTPKLKAVSLLERIIMLKKISSEEVTSFEVKTLYI